MRSSKYLAEARVDSRNADHTSAQAGLRILLWVALFAAGALCFQQVALIGWTRAAYEASAVGLVRWRAVNHSPFGAGAFAIPIVLAFGTILLMRAVKGIRIRSGARAGIWHAWALLIVVALAGTLVGGHSSNGRSPQVRTSDLSTMVLFLALAVALVVFLRATEPTSSSPLGPALVSLAVVAIGVSAVLYPVHVVRDLPKSADWLISHGFPSDLDDVGFQIEDSTSVETLQSACNELRAVAARMAEGQDAPADVKDAAASVGSSVNQVAVRCLSSASPAKKEVLKQFRDIELSFEFSLLLHVLILTDLPPELY